MVPEFGVVAIAAWRVPCALQVLLKVANVPPYIIYGSMVKGSGSANGGKGYGGSRTFPILATAEAAISVWPMIGNGAPMP
jgi:hypothetical protein